MLRSFLINNQVIDHTALVIAHGAVAGSAIAHVVKLVGQHVVQVFQSIGSFAGDFTHVRNVKQSACGADGHVFCNHAGGILNRHGVSGKGDHFCAQRNMIVIKWCL